MFKESIFHGSNGPSPSSEMKLDLVEAALLQLMHELGTDSTVKEVPAQ